MNAVRFAVCLLVLAAPAWADELELKGPAIQGGLIVGRTAPKSQAILDGRAVRVSPAGDFVIGFGRDAGPNAMLEIRLPDGTRTRRTLAIRKRRYAVQRIDGLPKSKVTPPKSVWPRLAKERALIAGARRLDTGVPYFTAGFAWPAQGRISGVYGSQRVLNGKPKRPHYGTDIAAPTGAAVTAAAPGRVVLVHEDMYYTGKTVMIDHGHGLTSVYIHMSAIMVREGDEVNTGDRIGSIGMTGRVTGPHLHWGVYLGTTPLDPALLVGPMPKAPIAKAKP